MSVLTISRTCQINSGDRSAFGLLNAVPTSWMVEVIGHAGDDFVIPECKVLLEDRQLYTIYLLRAGSLEGNSRTGAADINKFYGKLAPNFLGQES